MLNYGMGTNMPAILPMIRFWIIILACLLTCVAAASHPRLVGINGVESTKYFAQLVNHSETTRLTLASTAPIGSHAWLSLAQRQPKAA